ncbi:MAG: TonB-dependent receptor [Bacteroides sp.]|jgi:TonB-linked SusC/RagA family outer membrane protein|nr:TonB-dependent receptor [Bacteroides sp.]
MRKTFLEKGINSSLCRIVLVMLFWLPAIISIQANPSQSRTISGVVKSATDGEPLIGVSVLVKETSTGAITDMDGKYSLTALTGNTLVFSYIGYKEQEIKVGNSSVINVSLEENNAVLDEVVVIGYGVQKKKLVTGATVQVKGENIAKLNTTNPLQAMQGQTPGVNIASTSGQPGADMKVTIRGLGTVGNSQPLYLIDGVGGDISTLNPADIESVDVLKDAASAAIYGAQAANGVVLITTKQGREGKATVSFDAYYGVQNVTRKMQMLNAEQYETIMDEQALNSGSAAFDWNSFNSIYDAGGNLINTNWIDSMFKDDAKTESYTLGITGGSAISTFALSLGYMDQEGIVGGKDVSNYERYNFRINSEHKLFKNLLKVGEQVSFVYKKNQGISVGNQYNNTLRAAFITSPLSPIYSDNGYNGSPYNDTSDSDWYNADGNPYGIMMTTTNNENKNATFSGNVFAELQPIKNLTIKTVFGAVYGSSEYRSFTPLYRFSIYSYNTTRTKASQNMNTSLGMTWTNTASYDWKLNDHSFNALLGMEVYRYEGTYVGAETGILKEGFDDWDHAYVDNGTATTQDDGMKASGYPHDKARTVSYFGRLGWNWKETYMVNATLRCDGSSKFSRGNRYGWFPSISAGWTITNEPFMNKTHDWLDFLKLRASWGQVGNQNIDNYQYTAPIKSDHTYYIFGTQYGAQAQSSYWGAYPSRLANANIKWETSEQTNIGVDARFVNGRLGVNADFYLKKTKNWLVEAPILATAGTGAPYINGGDVKNTGFELAFSWNDQIGKDFHYNIGVNGAYNKNDVGNIPTEDGIIHGSTNQLYDNTPEFYRAENGHPIGYFWGYKTCGIFQNQTEIDDWIKAGNGVLQSDVKPGDVKYVDVDHNGAINDEDKVDLGCGMPDLTYGFNLSFNYKGLDFSLTANGMIGNKIVQSYRNHSNKQANYTTAILDRWTGEGTSNRIPRVTETNVNWQFSDLYIQDGDFLRISNITLGYDFAKLLKSKIISQARLYAQVQNAFTFTKYDGMDPEIGYGPESKGWVSGVDLGYYPRPRTILIGVNLKF